MALALIVLQVDIESGRVAQLGDRRRRKCKRLCVTDLRQRPIGATLNGADAQLRRGTFAPVLEQDETQAVVLARTVEAEAGNRKDRVDRVLLMVENVVPDLI